MKRIIGTISALISFFLILVSNNTEAWSNGGYSDDPTNPDYGSDNWIAQHALD